MLFENIKKLVEYGIQTGLTPECERIYTTNLLLEIFKEDNYAVSYTHLTDRFSPIHKYQVVHSLFDNMPLPWVKNIPAHSAAAFS